MSGKTIYTCRPFSISRCINPLSFNRFLSNKCIVWIGFLPGGSSSITLMSRSPYRLMASVRGMGVAVITRTCGGFSFFFQSLARWATPNLCCSSITASPRLANLTVGSIKAWVPINIWSDPSCSLW